MTKRKIAKAAGTVSIPSVIRPDTPMPATPSTPAINAPAASLRRIDLGCGQRRADGYTGMDIMDGADIVHDLRQTPWPFSNDSVDEFRASHVMEHFWGEEQIKIIDEAFRCLKFGSIFTIIVPWWNSARMWQDPTHKSPFPPEKCHYFNKGWRDGNGLSHYGITSDFDFEYSCGISDPHPATGIKGYVNTTREAQLFALYYYANVGSDATMILRKNKREPVAGAPA